MAGISYKLPGSLVNRFKYNGKEVQSQEFSDKSGLECYDFGARHYDQQIGMWHIIDPKADISRRWSTYNYAYDNPIRYLDPDGMAAESFDDHYKKNGKEIAVARTPDNYDRTITVIKGEVKVSTDANGKDWVSTKGLESSITEVRNKSGVVTYSKTDAANSEPRSKPEGNVLHKDLETAHTTIDAIDNTARLTIEKGFDAANKVSPATVLGEGAAAVKTGGRILGGAGIALSVIDAATDPNGPQLKHGIDVSVGVATFIPVVGEVIGVSWFVGNLVSLGVNRKGLSENIQSVFEKK